MEIDEFEKPYRMGAIDYALNFLFDGIGRTESLKKYGIDIGLNNHMDSQSIKDKKRRMCDMYMQNTRKNIQHK